jgi:hypothetical protein
VETDEQNSHTHIKICQHITWTSWSVLLLQLQKWLQMIAEMARRLNVQSTSAVAVAISFFLVVAVQGNEASLQRVGWLTVCYSYEVAS